MLRSMGAALSLPIPAFMRCDPSRQPGRHLRPKGQALPMRALGLVVSAGAVELIHRAGLAAERWVCGWSAPAPC